MASDLERVERYMELCGTLRGHLKSSRASVPAGSIYIRSPIKILSDAALTYSRNRLLSNELCSDWGR